eukprot:TRINITY_DN14985_c0_g1_i1.p1 TRINITY_DN14985_c0_g1~~TRINITY_DN14985_c0_g1_i1.p1  ORF type:complete len:227 (-),score=22.35 TRINITY_DN14985_c0_g1_i1:73-753(-)
MPKLFNVPWGKKKGGDPSSAIHGDSVFSTGSSSSTSTNTNNATSLSVFGQNITLDDDEEEQRQPGEGPVDDTVEEIMGFLPSESCCPTLSLKYRIVGFLSCLLIGLGLCVIGAVIMYTDKDMTTFAVLYSIGNVVAIASTNFLSGPRSQFKKCIHPTRLPVALVFLAAFTVTLVVAFTQDDNNIVLIFLVIQWLALIYYSITLFPCAHKFCSKLCASCCALAAETV